MSKHSRTPYERTPMQPIAKVCIALALIFIGCTIIAAIGMASIGVGSALDLLDASTRSDTLGAATGTIGRLLDTVENLGNAVDREVDGLTADFWNASDTTGLNDGGFSARIAAADLSKLHAIDIDMIVGLIDIVPATDGQVTVRYTAMLSDNTAGKHGYHFDDGIVNGTGTLRFEQKFTRRPSRWPSTDRNKFAMEIAIPDTCALDIKIQNVVGDIHIDIGQGDDLMFENVNGDIRVTTGQSKRMEAHTVNGSISLTDRGNPTPQMNAETVNGNIQASIPTHATTDIKASTLNGRISLDGSDTGRTLERSGGDGLLKLETVNGSIDILTTEANEAP